MQGLKPEIIKTMQVLVIIAWQLIVIKSLFMIVKSLLTHKPSGEGLKVYAIMAVYGILAKEIVKFLSSTTIGIILAFFEKVNFRNYYMILLILAFIPLAVMEVKVRNIEKTYNKEARDVSKLQ
jgi:hypothetical protein